ncbi:MAG: hypothetical protein H3C71_01355 [Flavobacteriales bacterium]|nr:hypothetical protein [Flavobacteriales bacterium]
MKKFVLTFAILLGGFVYMSAQNNTTSTDTKATKSCCAKGMDKGTCSTKAESHCSTKATDTKSTKSCCSKETTSATKTCSASEMKSCKGNNSGKSSCNHGTTTGNREDK